MRCLDIVFRALIPVCVIQIIYFQLDIASHTSNPGVGRRPLVVPRVFPAHQNGSCCFKISRYSMGTIYLEIEWYIRRLLGEYGSSNVAYRLS